MHAPELHGVKLGSASEMSFWLAEIATMWRFTPTTAITEGFHNKMEFISPASLRLQKYQLQNARRRYDVDQSGFAAAPPFLA